jgi:hypothetical protein
VWVLAVGIFLIGPYNTMPDRTTDALPIPSLPPRPVMQLAFARSQADIDAVLEVTKTSKDANIKAVRTGNTRDSQFLVPGYVVLLIALTLFVVRGSDNEAWWLFRAGVVLVAVLALSDLAENFGIARVLSSAEACKPENACDPAATWIRILMVASAFVKWTALGLIGLGLGVVTSLQQRPRRGWLTPLLIVFGVWWLATVSRHVIGLLPDAATAAHSGRSASMTSTRDARAAGTSDASTAETTRIIAAATIGNAPGTRTSSM